ncbi:MAG: FKBP-type peptidyl-prolyl cis-trans isomerase [Sphingobium sp.]|nr:FKBP-type peptidyl-prolyl cis-trans isomerase [Sphingobium sp.]
MSSVTAVPLQPIQKGALSRLWLAIIVVVLLAVLLAWNGTRAFGSAEVPDGEGRTHRIVYQMLEEGTGSSPTREDFALVAYKGTLPDGKVFDENKQAPMDLTTLTPGFAKAVTLLKKGGRMRVTVPAELGYGANPPPNSIIPANSPLTFDISLIEFKSRAEVMEMQRQMQMQQMLQQQMQGGGAPQQMPPQTPPQQ